MASATDLTDLATLKAYMSPEVATTGSDVTLAILISGVSAWLHRQLGRQIPARNYVETRHGNTLESMRTKNWPIISVASIEINGAIVNAAPPASQGPVGGGYLFDDDYIYLRGGLPQTASGPLWSGGYFPAGIRNVVLSYAAGWLTPGQIALAALPDWTPSTALALGAQINPGNGFICTVVAGTGATGTIRPTFPAVVGGRVVDGAVTWMATEAYAAPPAGAELLPEDLVMACLQQCAFSSTLRSRIGDMSMGEGPQRVSFMIKAAHPMTQNTIDQRKAVVPIMDTVMPGAQSPGRWP